MRRIHELIIFLTISTTVLASCSTTPTMTQNQCLTFCARQHSSVRLYSTGSMVPYPLKVPSTCECHESEPWTTEEGRKCYYQCQRDRYSCAANCAASSACLSECHLAETRCLSACPDLMAAEQPLQEKTEAFEKPQKKPRPMFELIH